MWNYLKRILGGGGPRRTDMVGLHELVASGKPFAARAKIRSFTAMYGGLRGALMNPSNTLEAIRIATGAFAYGSPSGARASAKSATAMLESVCVSVCARCRLVWSPAHIYAAQKKLQSADSCLNGGCRGDEVVVIWGYVEPHKHEFVLANGIQLPEPRRRQGVRDGRTKLAGWAQIMVRSGFAERLQAAFKDVLHERY